MKTKEYSMRELIIDQCLGPYLPTRLELHRMATLSFTKPVALWRADNAPVQGKRFVAYLNIAREMRDLLEVA